MFKNRVRTAALAGAIAVATGVSGVAVPAFAEDTTVNSIQGPEFNKPDASKAQDVAAENFTEKQLLDMTNSTDKFIQSYNQYKDLYPKVAALAGDGVDISEEQEYKDFQQFANLTTEQLAQAEKNVQAARASVAYALEKDKAADAAWNNYEEKAFDYNVTVTNVTGVKNGGNNPQGNKGSQYETDEYKKAGLLKSDIDAANKFLNDKGITIENAPGDDLGTTNLSAPALEEINPLDFWSAQETPKKNLKKFEAAIEQYKLRLDYAGHRSADKTQDNYIPREYVGLVETVIADAEMLYEQLKADTAALNEARDAARAASRESQKSDVLVRQGLLDRAWAQVYVLRPMEAQFAIGARVLELYESGENGTVVINDEQLTLRQAYDRLIQEDGGAKTGNDKDGEIDGPNYVNEAIAENYYAYGEATKKAYDLYADFPGDLQGIDGRGICGPRESKDEDAIDPANPGNQLDKEDPFNTRKKDCSEPLDKVFFDGASNRNDEAKEYVAMKIAAAKRLFGPNNFNLAWEEEYKKVLNADNGVQKAISDDAAAAKDREDQAKLAQKNADNAARIADALEKQMNGGDADKGGDNNKGDNNKDGNNKDGNKKGDKSSAKDKLSNNGKPTPLAIFGIVAGVLAAVAAAFPAIAKALNIKLPF
ncbi:hypothetical protein [Corynebacterium minutissimum]|uniref:Secreted protein n=1 Tax=Corynebacterium minutissimum TaxID=38301 RepID=A0A376CQQ4_9CORY|nr:hypothetical protein [Corynebacterium minutissimum]QRP62066.1 hypothetical protein I6J26_06035 [Corynebacterium minutissimum]STC73347.1 Uncharacterised protein [Corynebacterium minutissimum]